MRQIAYRMLACVVVVGCLTGCGALIGDVNREGKLAALPLEREAPQVTGFSVTPATVGFRGAPVTIQADVADVDGVQDVWATVGLSGAPAVHLAKVTGQTYRGVWSVPANAAQGALVKTYQVVLYASDSRGNTTLASAVTVTSTPPPAPPAPPLASGG